MKKIIILLAVVMLIIAGCGSSQKSESAVAGDSASVGTANSQAPEMQQDAAVSKAVNVPQNAERKIIKNAEVRLRVDDIAGAAEKIKDKTNELKGYPNDFSVFSEGSNANATLSLRVPAASYGTLLDFIVQQGKPDYKREYTNDVTLQYVDLDAKVKVLRAEEESLLNLLGRAQNVDDILKIREQITSTREQRESLEGQLKSLSQSVEYATIDVTLMKPANSASAVNMENLNIFSRSGRAFVYGLNFMTARLGDLIVFIFTLLPTLALLGLIIAGALYLRRRRKKGEE